jgi:hypothetical protein
VLVAGKISLFKTFSPQPAEAGPPSYSNLVPAELSPSWPLFFPVWGTVIVNGSVEKTVEIVGLLFTFPDILMETAGPAYLLGADSIFL